MPTLPSAVSNQSVLAVQHEALEELEDRMQALTSRIVTSARAVLLEQLEMKMLAVKGQHATQRQLLDYEVSLQISYLLVVITISTYEVAKRNSSSPLLEDSSN